METASGTEARACAPETGAENILPGADYSDVYCVDWPRGATASVLAQMALEPMPGWMSGALKFRDFVFSPFGVVPAIADRGEGVKTYGAMPVLVETQDRVVVGYDDWHLDFRIVLEVCGDSACARTFLVRHNWFGYLYWVPTYPVHKRVVPALLRRAVKRLAAQRNADPF